jgi:hypothetical protein
MEGGFEITTLKLTEHVRSIIFKNVSFAARRIGNNDPKAH